MAAVLIEDQHGTEIVFFDNGMEVHKASGKMIRITNELMGSARPRKFEYKTEEDYEKAWLTWVSVCDNSKGYKLKKKSEPKKEEPKKETPKVEDKKPEQVSIDDL